MNIKKLLFTKLLFFFISFSYCQEGKIVKYYDSSWKEVKKENATFYTNFVKEDTFYRCTSFWINSNKINCKSTYSDTLFKNGFGLLVRYYENGQISDSVCNLENPNQNKYHFYKNGKLYLHIYYDKTSNSTKTEAFDETGNSIPNFIYSLEPQFPGGIEAWHKYIDEKHKKKFKSRDARKADKVVVIVQFIIDTSGNIINVHLESPSEVQEVNDDAIKVISESPQWTRGISFNKPVKFMMRQPITYILQW